MNAERSPFVFFTMGALHDLPLLDNREFVHKQWISAAFAAGWSVRDFGCLAMTARHVLAWLLEVMAEFDGDQLEKLVCATPVNVRTPEMEYNAVFGGWPGRRIPGPDVRWPATTLIWAVGKYTVGDTIHVTLGVVSGREHNHNTGVYAAMFDELWHRDMGVTLVGSRTCRLKNQHLQQIQAYPIFDIAMLTVLSRMDHEHRERALVNQIKDLQRPCKDRNPQT